ncbi:hypothetical protein F5877DRAFT_83918, partial [Lentinula edodes]
MNPYRNFDHRPLCANHREICLPSDAVNTFNCAAITPSTGPVRTQKESPRASPYSSPSPEPQPRPSVLLSSSSSSIGSLSSELEYDSDREQLARLRNAPRRTSICRSDHGVPSVSQGAKSAPISGMDNVQASAPITRTPVLGVDRVQEKEYTRSRKTVTFSTEPEKKRNPPAMVFEDDSDDDFLIPKPPGEVGRP